MVYIVLYPRKFVLRGPTYYFNRLASLPQDRVPSYGFHVVIHDVHATLSLTGPLSFSDWVNHVSPFFLSLGQMFVFLSRYVIVMFNILFISCKFRHISLQQ